MATKCMCRKTGLPLNAKHNVGSRMKVMAKITARHDEVVNVLSNNILVQRKLATREQTWDDRKTVRNATDEIAIRPSISRPTS